MAFSSRVGSRGAFTISYLSTASALYTVSPPGLAFSDDDLSFEFVVSSWALQVWSVFVIMTTSVVVPGAVDVAPTVSESRGEASAALYPIALLIDELRSEDVDLRVNAMNQLVVVVVEGLLGPSECTVRTI